ncbi:alpha/beta fold hydrolase [Flavobacterium sp. I3-2]|uniref:alpha/beta fold hydrolase n=1 Tax=Flavobacterium sp. I3-2 TaxID=2748319 RepID=UPI0015AF6ED7|nr:alpha/beta fold hydrolase [Flavobacterium sp. I3-2]
MNKIPVYFMPGLAANPLIFEKIRLDSNQFECFYLDWKEPNEKETLKDYTKRIIKEIKHQNPVLIGVSFGGIIVQEIAKQISVKKVIIISSVKDPAEFPDNFRLAKKMKLYHFFPTRFVDFFQNITKKIVSSKKIKERIKMYEKYLTVRSKNYLDWGIKNVLLWENQNPIKNIVHIHGTEDHIFPKKYIKNAIFLPKATHVLILLQSKWLNKHLPDLILNENYEKELD